MMVRGSAWEAACRSLGITQSMGTVGDSYDNAMAESFFAGFKREVIDGEHYATAPTHGGRSSPGSTGTTRPGSTAQSATARPPNTNTTSHSNHS